MTNTTENDSSKKIKYLVVDTTAFIQNAPLQEMATNIITCPEVVNEITSKRQLRRLVVLPYDLQTKTVFPEYIKIATEFSKKTGDYPSLSATDIKVIALTYQLEKENVGTDHVRTEPLIQRSVKVITKKAVPELRDDIIGFYLPDNKKSENTEIGTKQNENLENSEIKTTENEDATDNNNPEPTKEETESLPNESETLSQKFQTLDIDVSELETENVDVLSKVSENLDCDDEEASDLNDEDDNEEDDDSGWITPSNVQKAKKQIGSELVEDKEVTVACITTDFAIQNVLKQMNLNVATLDGRVIKQLRTFILRCYTCFKTTSNMDKIFCPKCGNKTLKRVGVSVDENGKEVIHINARKPLTGRGKKFSLPRIKGGKHSNNPHLVEDQPFPDQKPSRLARTKNNPLDDNYIAGFSPFVMRDVNSKSAQLKIRPHSEVKYWMRRNPNEVMKCKK